jgi:hypothetical protein
VEVLGSALFQGRPVSRCLVPKDPIDRFKELCVHADPMFRILRSGLLRVFTGQELGVAVV